MAHYSIEISKNQIPEGVYVARGIQGNGRHRTARPEIVGGNIQCGALSFWPIVNAFREAGIQFTAYHLNRYEDKTKLKCSSPEPVQATVTRLPSTSVIFEQPIQMIEGSSMPDGNKIYQAQLSLLSESTQLGLLTVFGALLKPANKYLKLVNSPPLTPDMLVSIECKATKHSGDVWRPNLTMVNQHFGGEISKLSWNVIHAYERGADTETLELREIELGCAVYDKLQDKSFRAELTQQHKNIM